MKSKTILFGFLLVSCVFCSFNDAFAVVTKKVATTNYVDNRVGLTTNKITVQNSATIKAELAENSQGTAVSGTSKEIATVGWADTNRTSKVRSGGASATTLVDVWIE